MLECKFILDAQEELFVVHSQDSAIDHDNEETDLDAYLKTGDASFLQFKEGKQPTKFMFKALTSRKTKGVMARAVGDKDAGEDGRGSGVIMFYDAFDAGVFEIRNCYKQGDCVNPKKIELVGPVKREIGMHVARASGLLGLENEREHLGKSHSQPSSPDAES